MIATGVGAYIGVYCDADETHAARNSRSGYVYGCGNTPKRLCSPAKAMKLRAATPSPRRSGTIRFGIQNYVCALPLTILERDAKGTSSKRSPWKGKEVCTGSADQSDGDMKFRLATADDVMPYTPNNDTVYSGALLLASWRTNQ